MNEVIAAVITGIITLTGVLIANSKSQAVTDTKLDELTREVREHNTLISRVPVLEEQLKVANHRIEDLESEVQFLRERGCKRE
nr:MAG TPA: UBC protein [Caudoviricetes sp.]